MAARTCFSPRWQAQQAHIGDQLQPQPDLPLDPLLPRICPAGGAVGRGGELHVPPAAIAPLGQRHPLADRSQVGNDLFFIGIDDLGPDGHPQQDIVPRCPVRWRPIPAWPFFAKKCC